MNTPYDHHLHAALIWVYAGDWFIVDDLTFDTLKEKGLIRLDQSAAEERYVLSDAGRDTLGRWNS